MKSREHIFFIGIGGIGMSALARYYNAAGYKVSGYDRSEGVITASLQSEGIQIYFESRQEILPDNLSRVIYTPAVGSSHPLLAAARQKRIPCSKRSEVLGEISRGRPSIAIAGTHGKTTITSMLAHIFHESGMNFEAFLGGISTNYQTNYLCNGTKEWVILEADEYDRSFHHLNPLLAVITSIDADHLDIYGSYASLLESFGGFASNIQSGGKLLLKKGIGLELASCKAKTYSYHLEDPGADYFAGWFSGSEQTPGFEIQGADGSHRMKLGIPGRHNVENAIAAAVLAGFAGISLQSVAEALSEYKGVHRRFEVVYKDNKRCYIDDYAHHPEEIRACLSTARELFPGRKITAVFQPHLYSRTRDLAKDFAKSLELADSVVLLDIYPAREEPIPGVDSGLIQNAFSGQCLIRLNAAETPAFLVNSDADVLITMGAGDIDGLSGPISALLKGNSIQ